MKQHPFQSLHRRMGPDNSVWPMLALLLLVMLVAIGCVLWFMREAMNNERMALRETVAEAYRAQLLLIQSQVTNDWNRQLAQLDEVPAGPAGFQSCIQSGLAGSVICRDDTGHPMYPQVTRAPEEDATNPVASVAWAWQTELRHLVATGQTNAAVQFVLTNFAEAKFPASETWRSIAANAELAALELLASQKAPEREALVRRLTARLNDYSTNSLPAAQRRFLMHRLRELDPAVDVPTLAAEDLAARYLETSPDFTPSMVPHLTTLPEVWAVSSPRHRVTALFTTPGLRDQLALLTGSRPYIMRDPAAPVSNPPLPPGATLTVASPGAVAPSQTALATVDLNPTLPGWRLSLSLDQSKLFDAANQRVARYLVIGSVFIAAMIVLVLVIARGFGRQAKLARLKNDLVATVSHELKTPLTAMRALVETLLDTEQLDEKTTREYLQLLATENARLSRLIENFLTFSRLERNKFKFEFSPVTPGDIVQRAVAAMGERLQAPGCAFQSQVATGLPEIYGDRDALVTALLNLLDNAWKYSDDDKHISLSVVARNGHVVFAVTDKGIGLSPADSRRVFQQFYQADQRLARVAGGCGLGLNIAQSIVVAHEGVIQVTSEPGCGSTFTIELPAHSSGNV